MSRKPRKSPSHPRLEAEGWEDREPTDVIDLALERVRETTDRSEKELKVSREELRRTSREFHDDVEDTARELRSSVPPPPKEPPPEPAPASR